MYFYSMFKLAGSIQYMFPVSLQQLQNPMQAMLGANPMQLIQTTSGIQLVPYSYFNDDCDESGDDASDRSRSPSPPISGFSGSIVKWVVTQAD